MSHQTKSNSQSTVKLNVTQKPVCKEGYHFKLKLMTAVVFTCTFLVQGSSNSTSVLESNSQVHQQYKQVSETETSLWPRRCPHVGGGRNQEDCSSRS
ncbi:MAG: hypothetical protein WBA13_07230 [Microcoleaceae cyanobacterium]